jgi:hypothetical protein
MPKSETPVALKPDNPGAELRIAIALSLVWLLACGLYLAFVPGAFASMTYDMVGLVFLLIGVVFPLVLIWTVSYVTSSIRSIRTEATVLRHSMEQIKSVLQNRPAVDSSQQEKLEQQLAEISALTQQTEARLARMTHIEGGNSADPSPTRMDAAALATPQPAPQDQNQSALPLQTPEGPERVPISIAEFIKALNFPDNAEDREGFRVLRRAFEERQLGKLLRASQDVLTLLSQDGIYMDDLNPDKPLPAVWRKFAKGERGLAVAALGGIRDRSALTLAKTRLKNDPIFRDATHHFLRQFDLILVEFEKSAEDGELLEMSETRTARAFMLLGRIAGSFD